MFVGLETDLALKARKGPDGSADFRLAELPSTTDCQHIDLCIAPMADKVTRPAVSDLYPSPSVENVRWFSLLLRVHHAALQQAVRPSDRAASLPSRLSLKTGGDLSGLAEALQEWEKSEDARSRPSSSLKNRQWDETGLRAEGLEGHAWFGRSPG
jgi:hypothetical protein